MLTTFSSIWNPGDSARVVKGSLCGELGIVDHTCDSVGLEFNFDGCLEETKVSLQDIEHIFQVGDTVRIVAGPYMGVEGHLIQMCDDVFHVCQEATKEVQHFEPPSNSDSIEIRDYIQVVDGEHTGRHGTMDWFSKGDTNLWFRDIFTANNVKSSLSSILVPVTMVQWTDLAQTILFTKERGYDVKPGDS
ncbi:hypothetical protein BDR03DRAFT_988281, partial [Suillus americanus]